MSEINDHQEIKACQRKKRHRKLDTVGCGLFFIWVGIAILANLGWGIGLIGVGLIILAMLAAREFGSASASRTTSVFY
jgi:hypothetical protein